MKNLDQRVIVIGGGVGPIASNLFATKLTGIVKAKNDQDYPGVIHVSRPSLVGDRTGYLLSPNGKQNPGRQMADAIINSIHPSIISTAVIGVPCNTFHAQPIWSEFESRLMEVAPAAIIVNMIASTVDRIKTEMPEAKNIGLMSTTGTREQRIYHNRFEEAGMQVVEVSEQFQPELHDTIYNPDWGLKVARPSDPDKATNNFSRYIQEIIQTDVQAVILGCTEIPLAFKGASSYENVKLIDPMDVLAEAMLAEAD